MRIASYNVENLFARPKAFRTGDWSTGRPKLAAYEQVNALMRNEVYSDADKAEIKRLLIELDVYYVNARGAVRRRLTSDPKWAWMRKNRGSFDRQPEDASKDVESSRPDETLGSAGWSWPRSRSTRRRRG